MAASTHLKLPAHNTSAPASDVAVDTGGQPDKDTKPQPLMQEISAFVVGVDKQPRVMTEPEVSSSLQDPLAALMLKQVPPGERPQSFDATVNFIVRASTPANKFQFMTFLVGEGGQIRYTEASKGLDRALRFVWVRFPLREAGNRDQADMLVVGSAAGFANDKVFLQSAAWDEENKGFNFYKRISGNWFWAGQSNMAFDLATRLQGPFDGHVNGNLVMKELTLPWNNWHSSAASIDADVLSPDDPLRNYPHFVNKEIANKLQTLVIQPAMDRFTSARINSLIQGTKVTGVQLLINQILATGTVNFVSSSTRSKQRFSPQKDYDLPVGFFLDSESLSATGIQVPDTLSKVPFKRYQASLTKYDFKLQSGDFIQAGDTFFAFFVPAAAKEDVVLLQQLIHRGIMTERLAACLMMVDFPNPVYSDHRRRLAQYAPDEILFTPATGTSPATSNLEALLSSAILEASKSAPPGSAEAEFANIWAIPETDYKAAFLARISAYIGAVNAGLASDDAFFKYTELADSRRREFAHTKLDEFDMTLPVTNISPDAPLLEMQSDGTVRSKAPGALTGRFVFMPVMPPVLPVAGATATSSSNPKRQDTDVVVTSKRDVTLMGGVSSAREESDVKRRAHWSCK